MTKKGSIKETGEELPPDQWERFEAAVGVGRGEPKDRPAPPAEEVDPSKPDRPPNATDK